MSPDAGAVISRGEVEVKATIEFETGAASLLAAMVCMVLT